MSALLPEAVERLIRPEIRAMSAYHVPDAAGYIKLDAMENPYTWPEALRQSWLAELAHVDVNRYPDPAASQLSVRLRAAMGIPADMGLVLGNGSDELIQMLAMAVAAPGRAVLAPQPSFVMYDMIARFVGMKYIGVPLRTDFSLDLPAMLEAIDLHQPSLVFLAYPNNPSGNLFYEREIEQIIQASPGLVIVDEAYHAFAGSSFMDRLGEFDNLLVMRTLSKLGLAGLRLGLLAGPPAWIEQIDKVRLPYNINVLTQHSADFALRHAHVFAEQTKAICAERENLYRALCKRKGLTVYPSKANFILFRAPAGRAGEIFARLKQAGILIKNLSGAGGALADCLRVTVGTPEENAAFLAALTEAL
ncbi:MAG: histidinol-phosphate transaminase [Pseudomonadota bacterium]